MADGKAAASREAAERDPLRVEGARERLLEAAYGLFSRHGIHSVGIDRIIAEAEVAKATLYHHFPSKEALVIAFLDLREARWTHGWMCAEVERRAAVPQERALAVFDAYDDWFHRPDYEGCSFINTLLEINDRASAVYRAAVHHLAVIRELLVGYAEDAGASNPEEVGHQLQILLMGSIVAAGRGDTEAALRARPLAASLLAGERRQHQGA
jgi:AcrR family transcriptional regulator